MNEWTHWWNTGGKKWGPHSLKWPQPISLSLSNMFSNSVFYIQSKTAWWFLALLAQCFPFICEWGDTELPARLPVTREWLLSLPAWGENEMLQSVEAQSRESWRQDKNVSVHANWCPDPPPGCHCLLSGKRIKWPFTKHEAFHFFSTRPHSYPLTLFFYSF